MGAVLFIGVVEWNPDARFVLVLKPQFLSARLDHTLGTANVPATFLLMDLNQC